MPACMLDRWANKKSPSDFNRLRTALEVSPPFSLSFAPPTLLCGMQMLAGSNGMRATNFERNTVAAVVYNGNPVALCVGWCVSFAVSDGTGPSGPPS